MRLSISTGDDSLVAVAVSESEVEVDVGDITRLR